MGVPEEAVEGRIPRIRAFLPFHHKGHLLIRGGWCGCSWTPRQHPRSEERAALLGQGTRGHIGQGQGTQWTQVKENEERTPTHAQRGKWDCPQELGVDGTDQKEVSLGPAPLPSREAAEDPVCLLLTLWQTGSSHLVVFWEFEAPSFFAPFLFGQLSFQKPKGTV